MAWREEMLAKAQELSGLASWIAAHPGRAEITGDLPTAIANEIETARLAADRRTATAKNQRLGLWGTLIAACNGASFERALANLDAAEVNLLRLAPTEYLRGQLPSLQSHVNRYLPKDDPRSMRIRGLTSPRATAALRPRA